MFPLPGFELRSHGHSSECYIATLNFPGRTEKNHKEPQSEWSISRVGFERGVSNTQERHYRLGEVP
jgi:hypothetical protein